MPFDTALSGIRAASMDLEVAGNNIANASTTGFKSSRVEFGDVYATSVLGSGLNQAGAGVSVLDVSQRFTQGNVNFTENELDMAINGNGFFVVNQGGDQLYTRAGSFGLDDQGNVVTKTGAHLQGYPADDSGNIGGIIGDIQIQTTSLPPRQTTNVASDLNLDARDPVLQTIGRQFTTQGNVVANAQAGLQNSTTSTLDSGSFTLPFATPTTPPISFDLQLAGSTGNNGTVSVTLDSAHGVPGTITTAADLRTLVSSINAQIYSPTAPQTPISVVAQMVDQGGGNYAIELRDLNAGDPSSITLSNQSANANTIGLNAGATGFVQGVPAVSNGYPAQSLDVTSPNGDVVTYTAQKDATAAQTASELNSIQGVTASATTQATLSNYINSGGNMVVNLNGVALASTSLADLEAQINSKSSTTLPGVTAAYNVSAGTLTVTSAVGDDIRIAISSPDDGDALSVQGDIAAPAKALEVDNNATLNNASALDAATNSAVVGGVMQITVDQGFKIDGVSSTTTGDTVFQFLDTSNQADQSITDVTINAFDPSNQDTYNKATSMTVYDSLGNPHVMTQYFVKQNYDATDPTSQPNHWKMYVRIDGQDVGDPNATNPGVPTLAGYDVYFNEDGSIDNQLTNNMLVSNWNPVDASGNPTGALGPQNVLAGGTPLIPDPPTSSNFVIDLGGTTQFGSSFAVNDVNQNGYSTGQLSGLNIDKSGVIFARFTNGETQNLGQVVLANFTNQEGLQPMGDTMWAESFESGSANVGIPGSAALGAIQSGALEESNVDLSEQLVALILAQRNFQASAKTIETANQTTQTIINLR